VLDAVMETVKASTPGSAEAPSAEGEILKKSDEVGTTQTAVEAGPSPPAEARSSETRPLVLEKEDATEESKSPALEAPAKELDFIVRHASGSDYRSSRLPKQDLPRI
jgi:hypothetical protein